MLDGYSGATRIYPIIGDPIAQVKSPVTMTSGLRARGVDAIIVPVHVTPAEEIAPDVLLVVFEHEQAAPVTAYFSRQFKLICFMMLPQGSFEFSA